MAKIWPYNGKLGLPLRLCKLAIPAATIILFVLNVCVTLPGKLNNDALTQYREAVSGKFTDMHPPIMAFLWSLLLPIWDGPQPMLILHQFLHWVGFGLLADGLSRSGRQRAAWVMLASGAFPFFLHLSQSILKDVGMGSALIAAFGLMFWFRAQGRNPPISAQFVALILIAYGTLVRTNAVFALAPVLLYTLIDVGHIRSRHVIVITCLLAVLAVPVSSFFNVKVLGAARTHVLNSLLLFDLAGIAHHSEKSSSVLPADILPPEDLNRCYTPLAWDGFSPWGDCAIVSEHFGISTGGDAVAMPGLNPARQWLQAVMQHPTAYLLHRLKHFNSELYFFVPAMHLRFFPDTAYKWVERDPTTAQIALDYVYVNVLFWPVTWITAGLCILVVLWRMPASVEVSAGRALLISGIMYALGYAAVGIATSLRYYYWTIMAILTALIICYPVLQDRLQRQRRARLICGMLLASVVVAGLYARLADIRVLMF